MASPDHLLSVPVQARSFQGRAAGIVTRVAAASIDFIVVIAILGAIYTGIAAVTFIVHPSSFHWPQNLGWSVPVVGFGIGVPYLALSWCTSGRSYGATVLGLRVLGRGGCRLGFGRALARAALCVVFPLGLFWVPFSRDNRSLQDLLLRTTAVYDWSAVRAPADRVVVGDQLR
ncbi:MAG: domain containing protein [Frankiales bacterium]|jgi:uncharacterized RDD family membrane protein YckC|nr:domain containing protein [Frankiales bacterium]